MWLFRKPPLVPRNKLGSGYSGTVYSTNNKTKVIKVVKNGTVHHEVEALRRLAMLGIAPKVHSVNKNGKRFVMNKVGNMSLSNYLRRRGPGNRVHVQNKVRNLIHTMHSHGISHGDLKPDNVMVNVNSNGHIKKMWVVDLGSWVNIPLGHNEKNVRVGKTSHVYNAQSAFGRTIRMKAYNVKNQSWKPNAYMLKRMYETKPAMTNRELWNRFTRNGTRNAWEKLKRRLKYSPSNKNIKEYNSSVLGNKQKAYILADYFRELNKPNHKLNNVKILYYMAFGNKFNNNKKHAPNVHRARTVR